MPRQTRPPAGLFAQRLDHLFRTVHPKDRGPYTPAEAADAINTAAGERVVSGTYLWLLRTGPARVTAPAGCAVPVLVVPG